ncbi:MAG: hypothetical protein AAFR19_01690 [Pseudomonadota bacterium]
MNLYLEQRDVRGWRIAAIVEATVKSNSIGGISLFWGSKRPVALIIIGGGKVTAFDRGGASVSLHYVEGLVPGCIEELGVDPPPG